MKRTALFLALLSGLSALPVFGKSDLLLQNGDTVAICGDSITEQMRYAVYLATYLEACQPRQGLGSINFGRGGDSAEGFLKRMDEQVLPFHPNVVTIFYGMNDGTAEVYRPPMEQIVPKFKAAGVRAIVLGTGAVDTFSFNGGKAEEKNDLMAGISAAAKDIAEKNQIAFYDVHQVMIDAMAKAKAKYGKEFLVLGQDGVHPDLNGHLLMAYGLLKGLGCDGNIGTLTVNMKAGNATATDGHKVVAYADGKLTVESSRYPFCFAGDPNTVTPVIKMLEFLPFNQELNRYLLIVKNPPADRMKITWGKTSKEFTAEQLQKGINLADEFLDNPFCEPFYNLQEAIHRQQTLDTELEGHNSLLKAAADNAPLQGEAGPKNLKEVQNAVVKYDEVIRAEVRKTIVPVTHEILIEPAGT